MTTIFIASLSLVCSVEGEETVGLREGFGQGVRAEHHAVGAGPDPKREVTVLLYGVKPINRPPDQNSATPSDASSALTTLTWMSCRTGESDGCAFVTRRGSRRRDALESAR
jgi:hypothetical protein